MRVLTILVAILLAVAAAGCGGGDDEAASDTDTVVTETTDTTTTEETTTDDDSGTGAIDAAGCQELLGAVAVFSQALGGSNAEDVSSVFDEFLDDVPDDIRTDLETLANAYRDYLSELEGLGIEPGETPDADDIAALQQAAAALDDSEVAAASQRISTWTAQNCTG